MIALVVPFGKSFDDVGFDYLVPAEMEGDIFPGQIVSFEFGTTLSYGLVYRLEKKESKHELKSIISIITQPLLRDYQLALLPWIATHYFTPIHNSLSLFLPKNLVEKAKKNTLHKVREKSFSYKYPKITLSQKQEQVYKSIESGGKYLLYGITGSGKTEIYIKLINDALKKGKQALLLIPEIILTNQIASRLQKVFGDDILVINSTLSPAKKTSVFFACASGDAKIIIGTRSALFYPFANLDIIIIDEEHDNSYLSDQAPRYQAVEVANEITKKLGTTLLLASGTPSIASMYKALKGEYQLLQLLEKYKN